ncbi:MAG: GNAT family N-acetyltransferase [Acidimicrobiia bacterium]
MAVEQPLGTGWEPTTPAGDTVLRDYLTMWAQWLEDLARQCGGRAERHDDVVLSDLGSSSMFLNSALSLQPPDATDIDDLVDRVARFFGAGTGSGYVWFNAWPMPDLRARGFELVGHPPFMLRPAGGAPRPAPTGLRIEEVADPQGLADFDRAVILGFPLPDLGEGPTFGTGALALDDYRIFVGYRGDEPVTTASAHVGARLQHVELVATRPEWRGRGYGEAVTWRATLSDPTVPAMLIASDDGRPVYERMGYLPVTRFTLWGGSR